MQTLSAPAAVPGPVCSLAFCDPSASFGRPVWQRDRRWRGPFEQGSSMSRGRIGIDGTVEGKWG